MFRSSHFSVVFVFGHFWQQSYENLKILCNLCLHFARQDGQDRKNHEIKVTQIPKIKRRKYGINKTIIANLDKLKHMDRPFRWCHYSCIN